MKNSENKINNEEKKFSKNNLPDIDISKYNIDKNGNVLKQETLIKPWQQNMLNLLEKNACLEEENKQKDEEIKRLEKANEQLKQQKKIMKECCFNSCLGCTNKICEVKK